jgi:hypothetical protein
MKYKQQTSERLESALNAAENIKRGVESKSMTEAEVLATIQHVIRWIESTQELLGLEVGE